MSTSESNAPEPTTAPVIEIKLGGKKYQVLLGFRAYKKLGLNPFKAREIVEYLNNLDADKAANFLHAGIENAARVLKVEQSISADEVLDNLDTFTFNAALQAITAAVGLAARRQTREAVDAEAEGKTVDPPTAQSGTPSGPRDE